ncbi:MAG: cysteine--tRNA ligase [Planctomycetota bacterium]
MGLRVYNTLGRKLEDFVPLNPPRVGMYVCGPTVYAHSHLGHAKSYVSFDVIVRWLRVSGYDLTYVQNITDVGHMTQNDEDLGEDPIIREARQRGQHPMAVVEVFMRSYLEDMDALNVLRPDIMPRATGHIPEQIAMVAALLKNGCAYAVNGSVYFDVSKDPDYGKLSGRRVEEMEAGARVAVNEEKRHPADFALWKRADPEHIMRWPSPWGEGFPGWHIECSVMSQKYLGGTFDIHGGGMENQFPHHECEIAQAECATGRPFVRYWLHNNMCTINGQKMGKSLGNSVYLKGLFHTQVPLLDRDGNVLVEKAFEPAVIRHFILTSHYRTPLDFSNEALQAAESGTYKLRDVARELRNAAAARGGAGPGLALPAPTAAPLAATEPMRVSTLTSVDAEGTWRYGPPPARPARAPRSDAVRAALAEAEQRFTEAMNEDFNTAAAIASVFEFAKQAGGWVREAAPVEDLLAADALMQKLTGDVLGLCWADPAGSGHTQARNDLIQLLVDMRNDARTAKNFTLSDEIRQKLAALGIELKDTPAGTVW